MQTTRLLGFAPRAGAAALHAAMCAVRGPDLHMRYGPAVVALFQAEPDVPLIGRGREAMTASLHAVQRRLEVACAAGPFLPMDPAAACCQAANVARLLETAWDELTEALDRQGSRQQWDIALRWAPEAMVARHRAEIAPAAALGAEALAQAVGAVLRAERNSREAALLTALAPAVLAFAEGGAACGDAEIVVTVLVAANAEAAVEAALDGLAPEYTEDATLDMRGPQPPLSFSAVRVATVEPQAVSRAWSALGLPDRIDLSTLHRHWRQGAAAVHPDRQPGIQITGATVSELTAAYRLLRDLLPASGPRVLDDLLGQSSTRLIVPVATGDRPATVRAESELAALS